MAKIGAVDKPGGVLICVVWCLLGSFGGWFDAWLAIQSVASATISALNDPRTSNSCCLIAQWLGENKQHSAAPMGVL